MHRREGMIWPMPQQPPRPSSACLKRPFAIHADRLRPRLKGGRLGGPYFGTLKIAIHVFPVTSLQPVCPVL